MTLTLTPEQEARLERSVREGRFATREEAVEAAFQLLDTDATIDGTERQRLIGLRSRNLADVLSEYPWAGADIEIVRDRTPLRDLDL